MKMFAPNVMVVGDTIFDIGSPTGRPNPPADAARYEAEIMELRKQIADQPFGARWLDIVGNNVQPIMIVPTPSTTDSVAETFPNIAERPDRTADAQNGRGTPIRLKFNPKANLGWVSGGVSGAVLLVHELTHAYRSASGRFAPAPMAGLVNPVSAGRNGELARRFPNWEEWLAVVVENVFSSEAGRKILRTSWDTLLPSSATDPGYFKFWGISGGQVSDSVQFAIDYRPAIARILQLESPLYQAMRSSHAWFNPVRDYRTAALATRQ